MNSDAQRVSNESNHEAPSTLDEASERWFAAAPESVSPVSMKRSTPPPPAEVKLGEFLGDPFADGWFKS